MKKSSVYSIGIDIGGTKMSAVLFNGQEVLADYTLATPKDDIGKLMVMLLALIKPLEDRAKKDKTKIKGIGLGVPGLLDFNEGKVLLANNLPLLNGVKVVELVKQKVNPDYGVSLDNDANCFVRAEAKLGAGRKHKNVYGVIVGTGIGGGWWVNDSIYLGSHRAAGEPGTMIIDFETGIGLEEGFHKLTQNNPLILAEEAYRGDLLAEKSYAEVGRLLGIAFANIVNLIDPEIIVVGGGVIDSGDLFLPKVKKVMREHIASSQARNIKVVKSKLGKFAGAIGAALLVD